MRTTSPIIKRTFGLIFSSAFKVSMNNAKPYIKNGAPRFEALDVMGVSDSENASGFTRDLNLFN